MTSTLLSPEARSAEARPVGRRQAWPVTPPAWLWPLSIVLQVISAAALTAHTYFFLDDWQFILQARRIPLSIHYLRLPLYEHFSPITRLLDKLLVHNSTGSFALAHSLQLVMYAAAIAAFAFVARTILGNRWAAFALTVLFGQSLFLLRLLQWWTATANILPSTIFGLLALGAYLRWQRGRSRAWLIVSLVSFFGSLLDYEAAMLVPFYIAAVRLLVLEDGVHLRAWARVLRGEWVIWVGYLALDVAAAINFYGSYYRPAPHPTLTGMMHFLVVAVFDTFIPALFGIKHPQSALGREPVVVIACVLVLMALAAYAVYTRRRARRSALAFVLIVLITMLPLGAARIAYWGVQAVGTELYYQQSLQFMLLILVALTIRGGARRPPPRWAAALHARLRSPATAASLLATAMATYGVLSVISVHAMANAWWIPRHSRLFVERFHASVRDTINRTGRAPVLFDAQTPRVVPADMYDNYDVFLPMVDSRVRFDTVANPMYVVSWGGALVPVRFHAAADGLLARTLVLKAGTPPAPAVTLNGAACVPSSSRTVRLRIPLSRHVQLRFPPPGGIPRALRLFLHMPARGPVTVMSHGRWANPGDAIFPPIFARGTSGQYVPLYIRARALAIDLQLPGGACVSSLTVGSFLSPDR